MVSQWDIYFKYKHAPLPFPRHLESRTLWRTTVSTHFIIILEIKVCNALLLFIVHVTILKSILPLERLRKPVSRERIHIPPKKPLDCDVMLHGIRQSWFPYCKYCEKAPCYGISAFVVTRRMARYQSQKFMCGIHCKQQVHADSSVSKQCRLAASCFHASVKLQPLICGAQQVGSCFFQAPFISH